MNSPSSRRRSREYCESCTTNPHRITVPFGFVRTEDELIDDAFVRRF
jgi:hypothetical protein